MENHYHYSTLSDALAELEKRGYRLVFSVTGGRLGSTDLSYAVSDVLITEVYRFEGPTDPADETVVYALATARGPAGVLIDSYGAYAEEDAAVIRQIKFRS